ncbi:hypothetical protein [Gemmatimonas sp.]|jgi:hypothetical protein|uniref:hypothetical protein n=1 Tax=Gemmatimonas sp. TaxID=1962908 RepID=UPI00391A882B
MPTTSSKTVPLFVTALVLQVAAQALGGMWGAAVAGLLIGFALRGPRAFRIGFGSAAVAAALLLAMVAVRGGDVMRLAQMLGGNFALPGWAILLATLLLPALQSGGLAGGVGRLLQRHNA